MKLITTIDGIRFYKKMDEFDDESIMVVVYPNGTTHVSDRRRTYTIVKGGDGSSKNLLVEYLFPDTNYVAMTVFSYKKIHEHVILFRQEIEFKSQSLNSFGIIHDFKDNLDFITDGEKLLFDEPGVIEIQSPDAVMWRKNHGSKEYEIWIHDLKDIIPGGPFETRWPVGNRDFIFIKNKEGKVNAVNFRHGSIIFKRFVDEVRYTSSKVINAVSNSSKIETTKYYAVINGEMYLLIDLLGKMIPCVFSLNVICKNGRRIIAERKDGKYNVYNDRGDLVVLYDKDGNRINADDAEECYIVDGDIMIIKDGKEIQF